MMRQPVPVQVADAKAARARFEKRLAAHPDFVMKRPPKAIWPEGRAWCSGCCRFRLLIFFTASVTQCRACRNSSGHSSMVKRTYSLSPEEYDRLLRAQGGRCYICQRVPRARRLAVDHDHSCCPGPVSCGRCVRGLLCSGTAFTCNHVVLAMIEFDADPVAMAERIVSYLRDPPARRVLNLNAS